MSERLIARLDSLMALNDTERRGMRALPIQFRKVSGRNTLLADKLIDDHIHIIDEGYACRFRDLPDGRRQILSLLVPGDVIGLRGFVLGGLHPSITSLSALTLQAVPNVSLFSLLESHPKITRALWSTTLVDESISREWLVSIGKRSAVERVAHLLCELYLRLQAVALTDDNRFALPLTQTELADALGLSTVHVNRTLQDLRRNGFITFQSGTLEIHKFNDLAALGMFSANYLHIRDRRQRNAAISS